MRENHKTKSNDEQRGKLIEADQRGRDHSQPSAWMLPKSIALRLFHPLRRPTKTEKNPTENTVTQREKLKRGKVLILAEGPRGESARGGPGNPALRV